LLAIFRSIGFIIFSVFSCLSFSYGGCEAPVDSDLPECLSITDRNLNDVYKELTSVYFPMLDEQEKSTLKSEEREWIANRNKQCQLDKSDILNSINIKDPVKARCIVMLTGERIVQLQNKKKAKESELAKKRVSITRNYSPPIVPKLGKVVTDFVPAGYLIFEKIEADFNRDNFTDVAINLRPTLLREFDPRPLLILLASPSGGYILSARNDKISPTGLGGGNANLHGADALKLKGRSILVQDSGGNGSDQSGIIHEFELRGNIWLLVSTETWTTPCNEENAPKPPPGFRCLSNQVQTDLKIGQETNLWTFFNDATNKEKIQKFQKKIERKELRRFEDVSSDE
jgi:uncharacterized protein YecT (DUF1311 family)